MHNWLKTVVLAAAVALPLGAGAQVLDWKASTHYDKDAVKQQLTDRLVKYVQFDTQSAVQTGHTPSTSGQLKLAKALAKELKKNGVQNVKVDANAVVTGEIPSNSAKASPVIAFAAHLDTAAELSGKNVKPQVHKNYRGGEIVINREQKLALDEYNSPQLRQARGHDIVTASGGTLLGADDKNGLAVIVTMAQYLYDHPELEHGTVKILFTPDHEILASAASSVAARLGADYAYTVDGGDIGELMTENFAGRSFTAVFNGARGVHPGYAFNSAFADNILMAADFYTLLPRHQRPETTSGRRGFIVVDRMETQGDRTEVTGFIRAFTDEDMQTLSDSVTRAFNTVKTLHPKNTGVDLKMRDSFKNAGSAAVPAVLSIARTAMRQEGVEPKDVSVRSAAEAAALSQAGLPAADIFSGQFNIHTQREYADVDVMEAALRTAINSIVLWNLQPAPQRAEE